jgi:hypothetical protein
MVDELLEDFRAWRLAVQAEFHYDCQQDNRKRETDSKAFAFHRIKGPF